jgi:hypothetical protein
MSGARPTVIQEDITAMSYEGLTEALIVTLANTHDAVTPGRDGDVHGRKGGTALGPFQLASS